MTEQPKSRFRKQLDEIVECLAKGEKINGEPLDWDAVGDQVFEKTKRYTEKREKGQQKAAIHLRSLGRIR